MNIIACILSWQYHENTSRPVQRKQHDHTILGRRGRDEGQGTMELAGIEATDTIAPLRFEWFCNCLINKAWGVRGIWRVWLAQLYSLACKWLQGIFRQCSEATTRVDAGTKILVISRSSDTLELSGGTLIA